MNLIIFKLLIINPASSIAVMILPMFVYESGLMIARVLTLFKFGTNRKLVIELFVRSSAPVAAGAAARCGPTNRIEESIWSVSS